MRHEQANQPKTHHQRGDANAYAQATRRAIHRPSTSLGAAGHWIHILSVAAPLVIAETIKDPDKKWRALRLASVGGALLSEAAWTLKISHDRREAEEARASLDACYDRSR
jgi:hypothetical protein